MSTDARILRVLVPMPVRHGAAERAATVAADVRDAADKGAAMLRQAFAAKWSLSGWEIDEDGWKMEAPFDPRTHVRSLVVSMRITRGSAT